MRIYIRTDDGRKFSILAPLWIVKGALGLGSFGTNIAKRYVPKDQQEYIDSIDFKELTKGFDVLKDYKGLRLLEVKSSDGTEVTIVI